MSRLGSLRHAGCQKPNCKRVSGSLHRHHKGHEAMWLGIWASRPAIRYEEFRKRYYRFHPNDTVLLCSYHHAEIHALYDIIIQRSKKAHGRLYLFTWKQAHKLMAELSDACDVWLKKRTPGISSATLTRKRRKLRKL